jgi:ubiquitin carboxyl-terminal hydrolase 4/11/15
LGGEQTTTVNPQELEEQPSYQSHENDDDAAPLIVRDTEMDNGLDLHASIEDEGISVSGGYNTRHSNQCIGSFNNSNWDFKALNELSNINRPNNTFISGTGSEIDCNDNSGVDLDGSDIVQHDSCPSEGSLLGRLEDFNNAVPEGDDGEYQPPSPVPDIDDDNQIDNLALHRDLLQMHSGGGILPREFQVRAENEDEEIEEPATEIHVEEGEGLKMD